MERGIRKKAIYLDDMDYQTFMVIMKNALEKHECILHAYCLMTNHFHLLVETKEMEIAKFMRHLASCYANYFNRKYLYKGHLFEDRYKGCLRPIDHTVGIVGARRCTQEAKQLVIKITEKYVSEDKGIISGMAKGIDSYAHTACLKAGGYTVAFLGNGLDICYSKRTCFGNDSG